MNEDILIPILILNFSSQTNWQSRRLFVNGAEVTTCDACIARNGVVHVINDVIMSSNRSIAEVLESTPTLSSFTQLVRKANLFSLLRSSPLLTVFAPSNDAINENTMTCLCRSENRNLLHHVVKFHLVSGAEYNSTLVLRRYIRPKSCGHHRSSWRWWRRRWQRCRIAVSVVGGRVTVADSTITNADIAASNGVIHVVSQLLNNPKLNLASRCPPSTTGPPVTTTETPTTRPPVTTSETPTTDATTTEATPTTTNATVASSPIPTRPDDEDVDY